MPITLEHIAKLSKASRSTVSRVINEDPNVREETRQRVLAVIDDLNFQPNLAARLLAKGRSEVIGLVIPAGLSTIFTDPYFLYLIHGISSECNEHGYNVMLWLAEPQHERRMISKILHGGLLDGVLVSSMDLDDPLIRSLHDSSMPFVLVGRHPTLDTHYVDTDNFLGGKLATQHLIQLGCKRIATITGPQNLIAGFDRLQGYKSVLKENGIPVDHDLVLEGDFSEDAGYRSMKALLPRKPDAVFVANDTMAMGALRAMREAGLRAPEDIAIIGFDDIAGAAKHDPPLSTIRQPIETMGASAVKTLIEIISEPESMKRNLIFKPELVIRESSNAHAGKNLKGGR